MDGAPVKLHVYDIANTDNENLNSFLKFVNNVSREVRAGGIYHGASDVSMELHGVHRIACSEQVLCVPRTDFCPHKN